MVPVRHLVRQTNHLMGGVSFGPYPYRKSAGREELCHRTNKNTASRWPGVRKAKRQVNQLLKSDPMDVEAVEAALHELRQAEAAESGFGQMIVLEILKDMDAEARIQVIEKMARPAAKRPPRPNR